MMSLRNPNTVIGVVGGAASGKDTVADAFTRFVASLDAESDLNARFHRLIDRADGSRDQLDYNAFLAARQRENSGTSSGETNIGQLLGRADFTIVNNGPLADIHHQVENIVNEIRRV